MTTYAIYALCGLSLLQTISLLVLLKRRKDVDLTRFETRLSHFAEALALLTDTTQSGFTSVAAELARLSGVRVPAVSRVATSKRIVTAARKGRSIQDIAADEQLSESEIRLTLGLADNGPEPEAAPTRSRAARTPARKAVKTVATAVQPQATAPAVPAVVHEQASRRPRARVAGNTLNLGA